MALGGAGVDMPECAPSFVLLGALQDGDSTRSPAWEHSSLSPPAAAAAKGFVSTRCFLNTKCLHSLAHANLWSKPVSCR